MLHQFLIRIAELDSAFLQFIVIRSSPYVGTAVAVSFNIVIIQPESFFLIFLADVDLQIYMLTQHQIIGIVQFHIERIIRGTGRVAVGAVESGITIIARPLICLDLCDRPVPQPARFHSGIDEHGKSLADLKPVLFIYGCLDPVCTGLEQCDVGTALACHRIGFRRIIDRLDDSFHVTVYSGILDLILKSLHFLLLLLESQFFLLDRVLFDQYFQLLLRSVGLCLLLLQFRLLGFGSLHLVFHSLQVDLLLLQRILCADDIIGEQLIALFHQIALFDIALLHASVALQLVFPGLLRLYNATEPFDLSGTASQFGDHTDRIHIHRVFRLRRYPAAFRRIRRGIAGNHLLQHTGEPFVDKARLHAEVETACKDRQDQ